jgi:ankyrin repeat protein
MDVDAAGARGWSILIWAAIRNQMAPVVRFLLKQGANVNHQTEDGNSALHMAARTTRSCRLGISELLIERGANVSATNSRGESPLFTVLRNFPYTGAVKLLLEAGADLNLRMGTGMTPMELLKLWLTPYEEGKEARHLILKYGGQNALSLVE